MGKLENYLLQRLFECYESNGKQRLVDRYIYNREEFLNFDSDLGQYVAVTELGQPEAEEWNRTPQILQQAREEVTRVCKHNYGLDQKLVLKHLGEEGPGRMGDGWRVWAAQPRAGS